MNLKNPGIIKVAILDLYEGAQNQGMRCIREILNQFAEYHQLKIERHEFEVRLHHEMPDLSYDIYISSGGPGSPLESEGSEWEQHYFNWLQSVEAYNRQDINPIKKQVFFICHSFQLVCRHWQLATVSSRRSTSFGVFPVHKMKEGEPEPIFEGLKDPFYAVDSRDYQVTQPNQQKIRQRGGRILAIEKARPHVPLERAVMAMRFDENMVGTQFHPEADAVGMTLYLLRDDKKQTVVENHGTVKWKSMIEQLNDPDKILFTYSRILPNFLQHAIYRMQLAEMA